MYFKLQVFRGSTLNDKDFWVSQFLSLQKTEGLWEKPASNPQMRHCKGFTSSSRAVLAPSLKESKSNYMFKQSATTHNVQTFLIRTFPLNADTVVNGIAKIQQVPWVHAISHIWLRWWWTVMVAILMLRGMRAEWRGGSLSKGTQDQPSLKSFAGPTYLFIGNLVVTGCK